MPSFEAQGCRIIFEVGFNHPVALKFLLCLVLGHHRATSSVHFPSLHIHSIAMCVYTYIYIYGLSKLYELQQVIFLNTKFISVNLSFLVLLSIPWAAEVRPEAIFSLHHHLH